MSAPRVCRRRQRRGLYIALCTLAGLAIVPAMIVRAEGRSLPGLLRHGPGVSNHPVNIIPPASMRIPSDLPLSSSGTMTCLTCHESLPAAGTGGSAHLRGVADGEYDAMAFCARCHADGDDRTAKGMHWMAVLRAHVTTDDDRHGSGGSLDMESRRCMECHDGVTAREYNNSSPWNRGGSYVGDRRRDHPVGVAYPRRTPAGYDSTFRFPSQLPKQMRLPEGKVSCVSCHDLYAPEPELLTVPIQESRLCLTCHNMD
ncbi:MAG TPA: cytochrome c3 family protein [Phycisphaerae bacterium]|nr:cytochrome c3 family protein [Phycisphaerae bacterium]